MLIFWELDVAQMDLPDEVHGTDEEDAEDEDEGAEFQISTHPDLQSEDDFTTIEDKSQTFLVLRRLSNFLSKDYYQTF